ncbi:hypothetical protein B0F88_111140 [Methylobacter tundripaludum]|uniref:Uncharacterized protein n=1 Tax=Methylobacter tundripaludum TaxID=173365 RepID=A0A2S6GU09_9GAMM|nr:hypothetical protein B0F88_111140 [Methylobacter tundripaludum]
MTTAKYLDGYRKANNLTKSFLNLRVLRVFVVNSKHKFYRHTYDTF